jgi:hydrogenase nickel incorporation protein HypB
MAQEGKEPKDRILEVEASILSSNEEAALRNRDIFQRLGIRAINLISSPGTGKTSLLVETLRELSSHKRCAVIEGDQYTDNDAKRIAETGVQVVQINTQSTCHLDATMVANNLEHLNLQEVDLLFIENVGNLICPAEFDLGEDEKVVLISVTEGEDKPVKYPLIFHLASAVVVTKTDLIPHLRIDIEQLKASIRKLNAKAPILLTTTFEPNGIQSWIDWLINT